MITMALIINTQAHRDTNIDPNTNTRTDPYGHETTKQLILLDINFKTTYSMPVFLRRYISYRIPATHSTADLVMVYVLGSSQYMWTSYRHH